MTCCQTNSAEKQSLKVLRCKGAMQVTAMHQYWFRKIRSTLCLKKVPTFKISETLSNLDRFSKFLHCWKAYEICTKPIWQCPPHLRNVATIPLEIKNSNFCRYSADMEENAKIFYSPLTLLFVHKFWYFRCLKMGCLSPYWLQIKFCSFGYLLLRFCSFGYLL